MMKRMVIFMLAVMASWQLYAGGLAAVDTARNHYTRGEFYEAQLIYQQLADSNYSSYELFYNLGNCYFRGEQFAQAIYYYEKALQLKPGDENAETNLRIANSRITDKMQVIQPVFYIRWYNAITLWFSSDAWAVGFVISLCLCVACAIFFLLMRKRNLKILGFMMAALFLIFSVLSLHFSIKERSLTKFSKNAIVFEDTMVKSSPSSDGNNLFEIHKGLKVSVTDTLNNWSEIRLPDGKTGWAESWVLKRL
ncbi:MAG TPA: tetratricopeptide repeat protein [Bacteroidales bacterium]|nr:tetratricopeptide repeat protein [Bacteroidales bacterium]